MKQTAIVTGASRGIGFAIAMSLAKSGYNVVITARSPIDKCRDNYSLLKKTGANCLYIQSDNSVDADRRRVLELTLQKFGAVHLLINNAGVAPLERNDILDMSEESFDRVIAINTKGTMFMSQIVARQMLKQDYLGKKRGTIINISSCSATVSSVNRAEYCVSKAGIAMITTLFADRLAPHGILVHEVRPGVIKTDMTSGVKQKYDNLFAAGNFPIARWGEPEDVANAVCALAGDSFLYTTGGYINIDGGFHIQRL
jgi:3-oxoacyl-[acyl-carrier protein] reductase